MLYVYVYNKAIDWLHIIPQPIGRFCPINSMSGVLFGASALGLPSAGLKRRFEFSDWSRKQKTSCWNWPNWKRSRFWRLAGNREGEFGLMQSRRRDPDAESRNSRCSRLVRHNRSLRTDGVETTPAIRVVVSQPERNARPVRVRPRRKWVNVCSGVAATEWCPRSLGGQRKNPEVAG